jgi:hypothetical protein
MNLDPQLIWIGAAVIAVLVVALIFAATVRRRRSLDLREHFGSEYDHVVRTTKSRTRAEEELLARAEEAKSFEIRALNAAERERFRTDWRAVESRFIDRPTTAVVEADELIGSIMRTSGYPLADFEKHAALLSVKHPKIVEHYRKGHAAIDAHGRGSATTEDLRQAMLHYRTLFDELVGAGRTDVPVDINTVREVETDRAADRAAIADEHRPGH